MEPYRRRLQLDRQEVLLLFCVFVLVSGLMFTLGMMMGYGMRARMPTAEVAEESTTEAGHETAHAGAHGKKASAEGAHTAANEHESEASEKLMKALEVDKQKALNESVLRDNTSDDPNSVQDVKAQFAANAETPTAANAATTRAPASVPEPKAEKAAETSSKDAKKTATAQSGVRGLFERKPASVDPFHPASGAFTVQIASFASEDESSAKVKVLRQAGFDQSYVQAIRLQNGEVWYRVAVGSYPSSVWAKKTGEKLVRRRLAGDFVIRKIP